MAEANDSFLKEVDCHSDDIIRFSAQSWLDSSEIQCNSENIGKHLIVLTQEMRNFGLVPYSCDNFTENDTTPLIEATLKLIKTHHSLLLSYDELHSRHLRAASDLHCCQAGVNRLQVAIEQRKRNLVTVQENERFVREQNKVLTNKMKAANEEIKRLNCVLESRQVQYNHELRKKEREINKFKDRLESVACASSKMKSSNNDRHFGISVANLLSRPNGARGQWKNPLNETKQEKEFFKDVIQSFEERLAILANENRELRESRKDLKKLSPDKVD